MDKFQIEIVDTEVQLLSGTSKAGKPYEMSLQVAYLHNGGAYPEKFEVILPRGENGSKSHPYQKGFYPYKTSPRVFGGRIINDIVLDVKPSATKLT